MTSRLHTCKRALLTPLVYLAAIFLLFEEWLWYAGARLMAHLARVPLLRSLEGWIGRQRPYAALAIFVLPALLLFPVKVLALFVIARGHLGSGLCMIVFAKLIGVAAVARLYTLTRPALLTLGWFARWMYRFIAQKERWIGRLCATRAWQQASAMTRALKAGWCAAWARVRPRGGRTSSRPTRVLRRFIAMWRTRRR